MSTQVISAKNQVLPPANGKKLWRVKRSTSESNDRSTECLNNSLKISAAAAKFTVKRPPLRRPKNKPGKPKDFVFVDLSPIKKEGEKQQQKQEQLATPPMEQVVSPMEFSAVPQSYDVGAQQMHSMSDDDSLLSLGYDFNQCSPVSQASSTGDDLMGLGIQWEQQDTYQQLLEAQQTMMVQYQQIQALQEQLKQQQSPIKRQRAASGPIASKVTKPHQRRVASVPTISVPVAASSPHVDFDDFMSLNNQFDGLDTSFDFGF